MTTMEAYDILQKRQINEDRILAERTSMFLVATSFLFAAFVVLLTSDSTGCIFKALGIILSGVGIILTFLLYIFNRGAVKALTFWHDSQCQIERKAPEFAYMREHNICPHLERFESKEDNKDKKPSEDKKCEEASEYRKRTSGTRPIYKCWLPLTFGGLWVAALVVAIARIFS
jgi:hypothetical protein